MGSQGSYQFGVEIELLLGGRKKPHSSWTSLAKDLSKRLTKAGIENHINDTNSKSRDNYREWSIVQEVTIPSQPAKNLYGIELVSPIYPVGWYWAADLDVIFTTVRSAYIVAPSSHCSTHVHISGTPSTLATHELASLAKAALYFEPALDALVAPSRRGSSIYWCQSLRANAALKDYPLPDCLAVLDHAAASGSTHAVVEAVNLCPAAGAYGRAHGKKHDYVRGKVYKWDFSGMLPKSAGGTGMGTIEFRQPPGSSSADEAGGWVALALAFVAGVCEAGFDVVDAEGGGGPEELWGLLGSGAEALGWEEMGLLEGVFERRE